MKTSIKDLNSYILRCEKASKEQGIDELVHLLKDLGIKSTSEQTGGFTMCACVLLSNNRYIYATPYGASLYDSEDFDLDIIQLDEPNSQKVAQSVAQWVKENN